MFFPLFSVTRARRQSFPLFQKDDPDEKSLPSVMIRLNIGIVHKGVVFDDSIQAPSFIGTFCFNDYKFRDSIRSFTK